MASVKITVAKTAGFCFGVARAIHICEELAKENKLAFTLGPIIHNPQIVEDLEKKGIKAVSSLSEVPSDATVVIRSHGVEPRIYEELKRLNLNYIDASCKDVIKIHEIVKKASEENKTILIVGDKEHPEVIATAGFAGPNCYIFDNEVKLTEEIYPKTGNVPIIIVAQTTFNLLQYQKYVEVAKTLYSDVEVYDTVCNAMLKRQHEAGLLSKENDICIIIGGRQSSNSKKLYELAGLVTKSYLIETKDELFSSMFKGVRNIAVTAGASTPTAVIEEVLSRMDELIKENGDIVEDLENVSEKQEELKEENTEVVLEQKTEEPVVVVVEESIPEANLPEIKIEEESLPKEESLPVEEILPEEESLLEEADETEETYVDEEGFSFATALEGSYRPLRRNQRVSGVVTQIKPNEIVVDIGSKQTGIIPIEELSESTNFKPEDIVTVGERLNLIVIQTNDLEGITTLSKKRYDSSDGFDVIVKAFEEGTILTAYVTDIVEKGLVAIYKNVRIFIPASQATARPGMKYDNLLKTNVKIKIIEVNPGRRRIIGSIRQVLVAEQNKLRDAFWAGVEEGKEYIGTVRSLTNYGAFVDLGGVDGMVHVSELSWKRVRTPADVVSVGQQVSVYVKGLDLEKRRISLGYRKVEDDPWLVFENKYAVGDIFDAPIVSLTPFGAFARLTDDIDGLIHISEISHDHINNASDVLSIGDIVSVKLMSADNAKRRVSLSMRYDGAPILEVKSKKKVVEEVAEETPTIEVSDDTIDNE